MSLFGDALRVAAPIAAGWYGGPAFAGTFGGSTAAAGIASGAFAGMGIAALTGEDLLSGGLTGAFGGYSGQGLQAAFNPAVAGQAAIKEGTTTAVMNDAMMSPYTGVAQGTQAGASGSQLGMFSNPAAISGTAQPATTGIVGANGQIGANMGQVNVPSYAVEPGVTGPASVAPNGANIQSGTQMKAGYGTTGNASKVAGIRDAGSGGYAGNPAPPDTSFGASMDRFGYGRAGLMALPLLIEDEEYEEYDESKDAYDPDATLNLNDIDTGIGGALKEDSGLRLYADGGIVNQTPMNLNNVGANVSGGGMNVNNVGADVMGGVASNLTTGLGGLNVNTGAMGLNAEQQDLIDNPKYRLVDTGLYGQKKYVPTDYMGMGQYQDDLMGTTQKAGEAEAAQIAALQAQLEGSGPLNTNSSMNVNNVGGDVMGGGMNVNNLPTTKFAMGGLTEGPGDGMSDDIPTTIDNEQPAALSDGEFVVPADVVSHLGNGSTEAGSKQLYAMMDEVRKARTGTTQQGKEIDAQRFMPA
jgi:hypothetical protein